MISVAAIDKYGARAKFSNYGKTSVDLAAPGVTVFSTVPLAADTVDYTPDGYAASNGTSMAAPHVTGAAALYAAKYRDASTGQTPSARVIREALLHSARQTPTASVAVNGKTPVATGGRLNIPVALAVQPTQFAAATFTAPAPTTNSSETASASGWFDTDTTRRADRTGVWALLGPDAA